jgi:ketosteroid isomerase-like protein
MHSGSLRFFEGAGATLAVDEIWYRCTYANIAAFRNGDVTSGSEYFHTIGAEEFRAQSVAGVEDAMG